MIRNRFSPDRREDQAGADLAAIVRWYFREVYGRHEGPGILPFYCDPRQVGHFALERGDLEAGDDGALFRLFIALAMYQARRDVVIMRQQRSLSARTTASLVSLPAIARQVRANPCRLLRTAEVFDEGCTVQKLGSSVDCSERPGAPCHVKTAAGSFNRMADLGKLPTSAWLRVWRAGGLRRLLREVIAAESDPGARAELLVARLSQVRRVGRKLATMFVSTLSVPSLAPGLTPWHPLFDGNELVVIDTNVVRGLKVLAGAKAPTRYQGGVRWFREAAKSIDLRRFCPEVPSYSPRLVQQALYAFCSRSNRVARQDACLKRRRPCTGCVPALCPFPTVECTAETMRLAVAVPPGSRTLSVRHPARRSGRRRTEAPDGGPDAQLCHQS